MIEKEIEIKNVNKQEILKKLKKINAELVFKGKQINRVFDYEDKSLWNRKQKSCVRIRTEGKKTIVTFWSELKSKTHIKKRGHTEFETNDLKETVTFFKNIGMKQLFPTNTKQIERYEKNEIIFELKTHKQKTNLEIEAKTKKKIEEGIKLIKT